MNPPTRKLRARPDLNQLRRQAKELLDAYRAGDPAAVSEVNLHYRHAEPSEFALHHAQLVLARSHGFDNWPSLKAHVDGVTVQHLAEAVRAGDLTQVRSVLETRPELADMEMSESNEHRPLHFAVLERRPEMVRLLMEHGADARKGIYPHRGATTALVLATERGYEEIVGIIQEEEQHRRERMSAAKVTGTQDELSEAIWNAEVDRSISMLEASPQSIHAADRDGWTPLHAAAGIRNERLVTWLLQHGADPNRQAKENRRPIDVAAIGRGTAEQFDCVARILLDAGAEMTPHAAVALGDLNWLRIRHAEGTLVNLVDFGRGGLLTVAVKHDRPAALKLLLDSGFEPDERVRSTDSGTDYSSQAFPLWECAAAGKTEMAEMLLDYGANPNLHVYASGSPVYSAYSHRQQEMAELLKRRGGVVTPDIVAIYRDTESARRLLAGTEPENRKVAEELLEFGAMGGEPEIVRMALERVDWKSDDSRWFYVFGQPTSFWNHIPWLYAGRKEFDRTTYVECFRLIMQRCGPNVGGKFGRTMLHEVATMGDHVTPGEAAEFAEVLLEAGALLTVRDDILKSTPLGWACRWGNIAVAELILQHGADPLEGEAEPWATPRAWAQKKGHSDIIKLLERT